MRLIDVDKLSEDLLTRWSIADTNKEDLIRNVLADVVTPIIASQSIVPSGSEWSPCSGERLPDEKTDVLLQFTHNMAVGYWMYVLGEKIWYVNTGDSWDTDCDDLPIAWMPLPEPYMGE